LDKQGNALTDKLTLLAVGPHSFTAIYIGDTNFSSSSNLAAINFPITQAPTTATLASQLSAQGLVLTAIIGASSLGALPTGIITFSNGGTVLATANLSNGTSSGSTVQLTATFDATHLAPGQYNVIASYTGDANYAASTSAALALNLQADFTVADRGLKSQTVTAGQVATYPADVVVTPLFGFSSPVNVSCTIPAAATTCSVSPNSFATTSGIGMGTVTVTTRSVTAAVLETPKGSLPFRLPPAWPVTILVLLFFVSLLIQQIRTPDRRFARALVLSLLILMIGMKTGGCGGGGGGGAGTGAGGPAIPPTPQSGTAIGTYPVTVTATSNSLTHTMTLTLVVQ
jgi:hypothetical protein